MERALHPLSLLLPPLLLAGPVAANNTGQPVELRVVTNDGKVRAGKVRFRDAKLQVKAKQLRYAQVKVLEDLHPPSAARQKQLRAKLARRRKRIKPGDAKGWVKLARWAWERGLEEDARQAFKQAVELSPDDAEARAGLGQIKRGQAWVDGAQVIRERRFKLRKTDTKGLLALARFAIKAGARQPAFRVLAELLLQKPFSKSVLRTLRPLTDRYRQKTRMILPVRGAWLAHEDPTRHHQKNGVAIYALDLMKVDDRRRTFDGNGRRLADYFGYGEPFYAAAAGRVYIVRNTFPDLPIGVLGKPSQNNLVGIQHGSNEFTWYAHAQPGSIVVKAGQQVKQGQLLGKVGNSGKSVIPHLHFSLTWSTYVSVPWACDDYLLHAPDGTKIPVKRACPREGWVVEGKAPREAPAKQKD